MNEGEKSTVNVYQETNSKDVLKKQNYEVLTPVRRSTRINRPKSSDEVGDKEVVEANGTLENIESPKEKIETENPTSNHQTNTDANYNSNNVSSVIKDVEASDTFIQTNNGEEESLEAMFDDIFEHRYTRTIQSLLPKKLSNDPVKERKFFKKPTPEIPQLNFSSYLCSKGNLPAEDVSKVFKIISKPAPLSDITTDTKSTPKPLLKTYSNKRKSFQKSNVIESFGLPDHPIAPENMPLMDDELDVTIQDVNDITILDMEYIKEPWIITAEGEDLFPLVEEVRTKSEPMHDPCKKNGSFFDFGDSFENFIEPAIFTSSPLNSEVSENNSSLCAALKNTTRNRSKEIDIEAIKMNFKKILSRTEVSETQKQIKVKKAINFLPKQKNSVVSSDSNISSTNRDILFVEDNSLTVDNKELEFSNNLIVPKSNILGVNDKNVSKNNSVSNKRETKGIKKKLRSSVSNDEKKVGEQEINKNIVKTSSKTQTSFSTNEVEERVEYILPKKRSETDKFISKCNLQCHTEKKVDRQNSMKESNSSLDNKRMLRSEVKNLNENSTNKINNDRVKILSDCMVKVHSSPVNNVIESEKLQTLTKKLKTSNLHTKLERKKNVSDPSVTNVKVKNKRLLRSASQDCLDHEKMLNLCTKTTENFNRQTSKLMSDVKVTLEKYKFKNDMVLSKTDNSNNTTSSSQAVSSENKGMDILLSPVKKGRKSLPEITIILNPLDITKLKEKLPTNLKNSFSDIISPTRRKLRSTNTTKTDRNEGNLVNKSQIEETIDKNRKHSRKTESDIQTRKKDIQTKGCKTDETISNVLYKNKFISKSLSSIHSSSNSLDGIEKSVKKHHSLCLEIKITEEQLKEKSEFITTKEADLNNANLITQNNEHTEAEKNNTNEQTADKSTYLQFQSNENSTNSSERSEITKVNSQIPEKNCETEQLVEIRSTKMKENERKDEELKCNERDQNNLDLSNNYKCNESQKVYEQLDENEKLKTDDSISKNNQIFLDSEDKTNASYISKVEEISFSDLWKKEEDKAVFATPLTNKMEATKYLDKVKLIDIGRISEKIGMEEYKTADSESQKTLNIISDKTKTDIKESSVSIASSEGTIEKDADTHMENSNQSQEITGIELQGRELKNASKKEKESTDLSHEGINNKILEKLSEKQNLHPCQIVSQNNEIHPKELNPNQKNNMPHINIEKDSKIETSCNVLPKSRNKIGDKSEKGEKHPGSNARLQEKRRKLLGSKALSAEESIQRRSSYESAHPAKIIENSTEVNRTSNINPEQMLPIPRKRGRPRKSENTPSPQKPVKHTSRGRPRRRNSSDDMDLLHQYKEYKEKVKRSKSVAPSTLESRRKQNDQDSSEYNTDWIALYTRNKDREDNMDLLSRYKKFFEDKLKSKAVQNINQTGTTAKNGKELKNSKNCATKLNIKKVSDPKDGLTSGNSAKLHKISPETDVKKVNIKRSQSVGNLSSIDNIHPGARQFKVGDITWAQIGMHPFWPCLITKEPGTKYYKKIFQGKRFQRELYHVRFFGDKGRRAWISKQQIMLYSNRDDLNILRDQMKCENKQVPPAYTVKTLKLAKWERAVEEAEQLKLKNVKEKLLFFVDMFSEINLSKKKESIPGPVLKSPPVKRKSDECKIMSPPNIKSGDDKPKRIYKKKISSGNETDNESTLNKEEVAVDVNPVQVEDNIQQNENILNKLHLRRQVDEISEIDSKTSSDNITDSDTSLNSMEAQKALYKRNNLFKGISRDKVCQYCFKPGEVLKCRGRCNGSYHVSCSLKILLEKTPRKRKEKKINDNKITVRRSRSLDKSSPGVNSECSNQSTKIDTSAEKKENCKSALTEEDQVQIITVPSSVYNTPPRKTFPPDFKNMTLAEQIDYKMKEIMRKFESKTLYVYSSSESSSEENSGNKILPRGTQLNTSIINKIDEKKNHELTTNNKTKNDNTSERIVFPKPNEVPKLAAAEKTNKEIENTIKPITTKMFFFKHVTADCDSLKPDTVQEEKSNTDKDSLDTSDIDPKSFKCGFCTSDLYPYCFICHLAVSKKGSNIRQKCSIYQCGRFYHPECLKMWPQTQWSLIQTTRHKDSDKDMDSFVCPLHVCHTCVSDDPRAATARCSGDKIVKCLRCPSTYHSSNLCVPAGTAILSSSQIICPRHREKSKLYTINTTWCFLCSEGGNLICCETCPTSVHPECLPVNLTDDDKFICEDCESGRLPLYDEIVWVKLGKFRWWPALILFPNEVPDNIRNRKHSIGEFVVKFFGTYDYYWVTRGRSFLFQEGDTGRCNSVKKKVDAAFNRAVEEAVVAHKLKKEFKLSQEVESITSLKPPPYIRIKVNKPVGNVRHLDLDLSSTNACECDPNKPHPCGPESDCLNRLLLTECNPEVCPAGTRCKNQSFEKREYPPLVPYKTQGRGWGLKTLAPIKKGQFVIEYVGELIDSEEYQRRIQKMHEQKEENYYFLTIDKDRMIDAGPKGNAARFMNHCCQPNCETQKWTVNGDTRVGLFATEDIPADTELTFNYNLECVGKEKKVCRCGAPNCSGFIGVKAKQDAEMKKTKKYVKKKVPVEPVILPPCFICGKKGLVISCNNKVCNKTYHQKCLNTAEQIEGNKFICPWHNCSICSKRTIRCCVKCINSYCPSHSDGNIRYDNLLGFVCTTHDPMTPPNDVQPVYKRKKPDIITEETAVTSTTSDDVDYNEDWMPLLSRLERMNTKRIASVDSESDNDWNVNRSSTSLKTQSIVSDYESQDEDAVSSATVLDGNREVVVKRKRGRPRKRDQQEKKIRLSNEENIGITASSSTVENSLRNHSSSELTSRHNNLENR